MSVCRYSRSCDIFIGRSILNKRTSVVTLTTTTATTAAAIFPNADDPLSNWVKNPGQYK